MGKKYKIEVKEKKPTFYETYSYSSYGTVMSKACSTYKDFVIRMIYEEYIGRVSTVREL